MLNVELYYWRDSNGREIDVIADFGGKFMPIEIKSGQTINREFFSNLEHWLNLAGNLAFAPALVYGGSGLNSRREVRVLGWDNVGQVLNQ